MEEVTVDENGCRWEETVPVPSYFDDETDDGEYECEGDDEETTDETDVSVTAGSMSPPESL